MARSITTRSTNPKIMDGNIKILDDALASASTPPAEDVSYDNTVSGLTANDVQAAIDELNTLIGTQTSLLNNKNVAAGEWVTETISKDINNFKYLGASFTRADNGPDQAKNSITIPVAMFKNSSTSSPIYVIDDYLTGSDNKSLMIAYISDTSIAIYKGVDLAARRISINGIM